MQLSLKDVTYLLAFGVVFAVLGFINGTDINRCVSQGHTKEVCERAVNR